jgi:ribosomal peptide maturation radical SAM protein 1
VPQIDYIFSGPSLITFPKFVGYCMAGDRAACDELNGVFSKTNRARWPEGDEAVTDVEPPPLKLLGDDQDINRNIPLDYTGFLDDMERTLPPEGRRPVLLFETSRGCWWAEKAVCSFCGLNGLQMKHRHMHPDQALKHIQSLFPYVPRCPNYMAVDTILPKGYTRDVFPQLNPPQDMKMFYELKVDISDEEIKTLSESGVVAFQPGIESLNTGTLKLMRKGTSAFRNILFLKNCGKYPVSLDWNLLIYSPGEPESTFEKYQADLPLLMHLAPPSGVYPISFARFSRYFDDPETFNLDLAPQDFYGMTYPFADTAVFNVAYHFVDRNADTERINFWLDQLNTTVARWRDRWTGTDQQAQARLCFLEDEPVVYDSRGGEEKEHAIGELGCRVLKFLNKPGERVHVEKEFQHEPGFDAEAMIADLLDKGLLFNEAGRMLNLVMEV